MGTYADLQTRIITETARDDLADTLLTQLKTHIAQAIEHHAARRFWFLEGLKTGATISGNEYIAFPTGLRSLDRATIAVGAVTYPLRERPFVWIDDMAMVTSSGQPSDFAQLASQLRFWPKPNAVYPLGFIGIVDQPALSLATDTNVWTNQGVDLIVARTKATLFRGQFRDPDGYQLAVDEEKDVLDKLFGETARLLSTGMRASG
jgi:hypothetical protein